MANRIEAVANYLGSVANRTIGRNAWMESEHMANRPVSANNQPRWARTLNYLNRSLHKGAPFFAGVEIFSPLTFSKQIGGNLERTKFIDRHPYPGFGVMISLIAAEGALWVPSILLVNPFEHPLESIGLKLLINTATHISLDAAGAVAPKCLTLAKATANRIRNFRPPTSPSILAA